MTNFDYFRLSELAQRVGNSTATKVEKDEYMTLLYNNGNITAQQYTDYRSGRNTEEIVNASLTVGAILLIGYLLKDAFK